MLYCLIGIYMVPPSLKLKCVGCSLLILAWSRFHLIPSSSGSKWPPFLQSPYITLPSPQSAYWKQCVSLNWTAWRIWSPLMPHLIIISEYLWLPMWPVGQSSWLQIERSSFDSLRYQIFWEVVVLERGPLSLLSTLEELLERKSSGSGLENRDYATT
jgi:hypothetical protein